MRDTSIKLAFVVVILTLAFSCNPPQTDQTTQPTSTPTPIPQPSIKQAEEPVTEAEGEIVSGKNPSFKPKQGYVPDEQTAIKIAEAVWLPIYGENTLKDERPFRAYLKNGVWIGTGTLPKGAEGGTAEARISKDTGCILRIIHYQ